MAAVVPSVDPVIPPPVSKIDQFPQILEWIGFTDGNQRARIIQDAFTTYAEIQPIDEKNVTEPITSFSRRTTGNGKIDFSIRQTKKLIHLFHWAHDASTCSHTSSLEGFTHDYFLAALLIAEEIFEVRAQIKEKFDVKDKEA